MTIAFTTAGSSGGSAKPARTRAQASATFGSVVVEKPFSSIPALPAALLAMAEFGP